MNREIAGKAANPANGHDDASEGSGARRLAETERLAKLGHWDWNIEAERCSYCSEGLARLAGVSPEAYVRRTSSLDARVDWAHPADRDRYRAALLHAHRTGAPLAIEYRLLRDDGGIIHVREESVVPGAGGVSRGYVQDISHLETTESALAASEAALRRAQRQARIGSWRWDVIESRLISCSEEYARIHGVSLEEAPALLDEQMERVVHPDDRARVSAAFERFDRDGVDFEIEYRIVRPDGEIRHLLEIGEPVRDGRGVVVEQTGTVQDITERKLAEVALERSRDELELRVRERTAALRESEQRYRAIFDTATAGIGWTSVRDGRLILANRKLAEMFGYDSVDEFVSEFVFAENYQSPGERERLIQSYRDRPGEQVEVTVATRDGSEIVLRAHGSLSEDGEVLEFVAVDVTEQKRAEAKLRDSERRLREAQRIAHVGHWALTEDGELEWTDEVFRIFGLDPEAFDGTTDLFYRAVHPDDREFVAEQTTAAWEKLDVYDCTHRILRPDGEVRTVRENAEIVRDSDGHAIASRGTVQDITEQVEAEQRLSQAQKMEAVGQLTGGIAHDFNNLLAIIMGNTELLELRQVYDEKLLEAITRAASRGAELTQRLLAFSRLQPLKPRPIDLASLVSGMSNLLARALGEVIEVEVGSEPDLWQALADAGQVENALLNLAINARDAMPGGGRLSIECANSVLDADYAAAHPDAEPGEYVVLSVTDTGTGIPPHIVAHVFEPFFTTKEVGEGSGLGLSMVYGFARQSGGHVSIYSELERGTTVRLYLPRSGASTSDLRTGSPEDVPNGNGEHVLLIEDDADVRHLVVTMLEKLCYRVSDAGDVLAARAILASDEPVDLVLSDVVLPGGISGPEFAEEIALTHPRLTVIFMSGYPAEAARRSGLLDERSVLLTKPYRLRDLANALRDALEA